MTGQIVAIVIERIRGGRGAHIYAVAKASVGDLHAHEVLTRTARKNGMRNLREDGWRKIQDGVTTVEEVMRVTQEF